MKLSQEQKSKIEQKFISMLSDIPVNLEYYANQLGLKKQHLYAITRPLVEQGIIHSKIGKNGGVYKGEVIENIIKVKSNLKYKKRDVNVLSVRLAKCGHISETGRYLKCENCLPNLPDDDGDLIYHQLEEEEFTCE